MKRIKSFLLAPALLLATAAFAQYPAQQIAFGDGTSTLVSHPSLKYNSSVAQLSIISPSDNYFTMVNGSGVAHMQLDVDGNWVWWTPLNGSRKMKLLNDGQLRIGTYAFNTSASQSPPRYDIITSGGIKTAGMVKTEHTVAGSSTSAIDVDFGASYNAYTLQGATTTDVYHYAQANYFFTQPSASQNETIGGYQSAAQSNMVELNKQNYTDQGPGQIWSVQTNTFHPLSSNLSKFINTYVRTQLEYNNTIGTYYSLFLEAPFGPGGVSQISNYYGVYQESPSAKNFFGGKVWIGTIPNGGSTNSDAQLAVSGKVWIGTIPNGGSANSDAQLAVNGNIYCSRLKVLQNGWADFVFAPGYRLPPLGEVEAYIKANGHLPGVVTAKEVEEKGNDVGENQKVLLQKVEELTLYLIDMKKQMEQQSKKISELENQNEELKKKVEQN